MASNAAPESSGADAAALRERLDGFDYGYRMRCDCGAAVSVSAETYFREQSIEARVPCAHCGGTVHFGPAVAMLRDDSDPALNSQAVTRFAWYHTSTWPDWPSPEHKAHTEARLRQVEDRLFGSVEDLIERETTKALHVGTYEAAIENMLRRMHDQSDARSQFYLYRVRVVIGTGRINEGYRDENAEEAAQLTMADLDAADVDAIRYLNVHEAVGSLSLAIRPTCIAAVQRLAIPVPSLARHPGPRLADQLAELDARLLEVSGALRALPQVDRIERWRMTAGILPGPDGHAQRAEHLETQHQQLWTDVESILAEEHLPGVSAVVRDDVMQAVATWRRDTDDEGILVLAEFFGSVAALLTRPRAVVALVARQPWQQPMRADLA